MENFVESENELVMKLINLDELLSFQLTHDIQVIRGSDYNYECYIDGECYNASLTPMLSIVLGIKIYKEKNEKN